jgi:hypothetical protein
MTALCALSLPAAAGIVVMPVFSGCSEANPVRGKSMGGTDEDQINKSRIIFFRYSMPNLFSPDLEKLTIEIGCCFDTPHQRASGRAATLSFQT